MSWMGLRRWVEMKATISSQQAFRYALCATMAVSLAGLVCHFVHIPSLYFVFFIISAAITVYYSYGSSLIGQSLLQLFGVFFWATCCFVAILMSENTYLAGLYLVLMTFISYLFANMNAGALFVGKLGLVLLCFCVISVPNHSLAYACYFFLAIIAGGAIGIASNILLFVISDKKPVVIQVTRWKRCLDSLIKSLSTDCGYHSVRKCLEAMAVLKNQFVFIDPENILLFDHMTHALTKFIHLYKDDPTSLYAVNQHLQLFFKGCHDAMQARDESILKKAYKVLRQEIYERRRRGFFKELPVVTRRQYAEAIYLTGEFYHAYKSLIGGLDIQLIEKHSTKVSNNWNDLLKLIGVSLHKQLQLISHPFQLTVQCKIAVRASVTLLLAFIYAVIFNDPYSPWVILTANLVLLIRKGDTTKKTFDRIVGHVIGFLFALVLGLYIWPQFGSPIFWTPILIFFTAYYFLKNYFIYGAFLIISLLYIYNIQSGSAFSDFPVMHFLSLRLLDVVVGSLIALVCGYMVFPKAGISHWEGSSHQLLSKLGSYLKLMTDPESKGVRSSILQNKNDIKKMIISHEALQKSFLYQPERYKRIARIKGQIFDLSVSLFEELEAITRRLLPFKLAHHDNLALKSEINTLLTALACEVTRLSKFHQKQCENSKALNEHYNIEAICEIRQKAELAVEAGFAMSDSGKIELDELISYMGILKSIINLAKCFDKLIA